MTDNELLAENIKNYLESGVDLLLMDDDYRTIIKALEKQKTGHWINLEKTKYRGQALPFWGRYECSECNNYGEGGFRYCPNCGCKMEVDE